jgi:hypothetical protein
MKGPPPKFIADSVIVQEYIYQKIRYYLMHTGQDIKFMGYSHALPSPNNASTVSVNPKNTLSNSEGTTVPTNLRNRVSQGKTVGQNRRDIQINDEVKYTIRS